MTVAMMEAPAGRVEGLELRERLVERLDGAGLELLDDESAAEVLRVRFRFLLARGFEPQQALLLAVSQDVRLGDAERLEPAPAGPALPRAIVR